MDSDDDWLVANRANWDERVPIHVGSEFYDVDALRDRRATLYPIEEAELGDVAGLKVLHLQCHFGYDSLVLASRGAEVVGLDFSGPAVRAAIALAEELELEDRARFIEANVYDALEALGDEAGAFDLVFVTWGALGWLPDLTAWSQIVARVLKPGGALYLAEGHPAAFVFDDDARAGGEQRPGWFVPYFSHEALVLDSGEDYADPTAQLQNQRVYEWQHALHDILGGVMAAGLRLEMFREHAAVPWPMFECLEAGPDRLYRWPDEAWLPLSFSLRARKPGP